MVDQNWDRDAEGAGEKRLPQFQGPLDAVAANVGQKGQGSIVQLPGLSAFDVGLENLVTRRGEGHWIIQK